ncbi:MAG: hypothetical protein RJA61_210 [Candidatus Parcubacteria bacterium]|jgi:thiamine kinase-like enzyme
MIHKIIEIVRNDSKLFGLRGGKLSFMKMSTPSSGRELGDKVLIFIFENGATQPILCVKTTRSYKTGETIRFNFENLKRLKKSVEGYKHANIFASPLYLYDDGEFIFSIESVCDGVKLSGRMTHVDFVLREYSLWQAYLSQNSESYWTKDDVVRFASETLASLSLPDKSFSVIKKYLENFAIDSGIKLPRILQHGDMTPDNVLISKSSISLVDYDYVSDKALPGSDLFNFIFKLKKNNKDSRIMCERYIRSYFKEINAHVKDYEIILFISYLQEYKRKRYVANQESGEYIISGFKDMIGR